MRVYFNFVSNISILIFKYNSSLMHFSVVWKLIPMQNKFVSSVNSIGIVCLHAEHKSVMSWWRHQMEAFSALLAICAGNSPVSGEFPVQRPVTRSFDIFFDLRLNKRLSKQSWGWWFETLSCPLWRQCNVNERKSEPRIEPWRTLNEIVIYCRDGSISLRPANERRLYYVRRLSLAGYKPRISPALWWYPIGCYILSTSW